MNTARLEKLRKKGWSSPEIERALSILERSEKEDVTTHRIVYWSTLVVTVILNILVSIILIPLLLSLNPVALYVTVIILGLLTGTVYSRLITQINYLTEVHHISSLTLIPIIAMINCIGIVSASTRLGSIFHLNINYDPVFVGLTFAIAFIIPTIVTKVKKWEG